MSHITMIMPTGSPSTALFLFIGVIPQSHKKVFDFALEFVPYTAEFTQITC